MVVVSIATILHILQAANCTCQWCNLKILLCGIRLFHIYSTSSSVCIFLCPFIWCAVPLLSVWWHHTFTSLICLFNHFSSNMPKYVNMVENHRMLEVQIMHPSSQKNVWHQCWPIYEVKSLLNLKNFSTKTLFWHKISHYIERSGLNSQLCTVVTPAVKGVI